MLGKLVFGGLFALGGLLMVSFGLVTYMRSRVIAKGPQSPLGNEGEQLYCTGTVDTENCEVAPLSGEPCVNYELLFQRDSGGEASGYRDVSEVRTNNEFVVDEGDARVRFEGNLLVSNHEMFELNTHRNTEWVENESDIPQPVRETGLMDDAELSLPKERLVERRLDHGDTACCVGTFEPDNRAATTHLFGSGGVTTTFSNESPDSFERGNNLGSVAAYVLFGLGFSTPGVGVILTTLGMI